MDKREAESDVHAKFMGYPNSNGGLFPKLMLVFIYSIEKESWIRK